MFPENQISIVERKSFAAALDHSMLAALKSVEVLVPFTVARAAMPSGVLAAAREQDHLAKIN